MNFRKPLSFLLALLIVTSAAGSAAIDAFAAKAREAVGAYNNQNYLESQAQKAYTEQDLGCTYSPSSTTFKTWSPDATAVKVRLYRTGSDSEQGAEVIGEYPMAKNPTTGIWSYVLSGDHKNEYYTYLVTCGGSTNETQDVYSKAVGVNGGRSMIVDLDSTDPDGWDADRHVVFQNAGEAVVWETHVRDFSISDTSGVSDINKGKYLAFTEGGTAYRGEDTTLTCIDYLVDQGINCVQLMPVFDFGSVDESGLSASKRSGGYDPVNFNVPEGSYSTNPYDGNVRIREFKQMVQALHDRGISVVMNVAYGYTASTDSCFTKTAPRYYYRMLSTTAYSDGSGCGNETASDKKMFRKYMIESCKYWAEEYHIDGFCFDQMGLHDVTTMNEIRSTLDGCYNDGTGNKILMYGEAWTGGTTSNSDTLYSWQGNGISRLNSRVGAFGDQYRSAIIGDADGTDKGFVQGNTTSNTANIVSGVQGTVYKATVPKGPAQAVDYADSHNDLIMWDKIVKSNNSNAYTDTNFAYCKQMKEIYTLLLTSQGIPFMAAGSEFGRTKLGVSNSDESSDEVNAIDWSRAARMSDLAAYYKGLLAIRRNYSPLHSSSIVKPSFQSDYGDVVAYTYINNKAGEWNKLAVLVNGGNQEYSINLGSSNWVKVANENTAGLSSLGTVSGNTCNIPAKGCAVLVDSVSFNNLKVKEEFGKLTVNHTDDNGNVLKTQQIKYRPGSTFRAAPDDDLLYDYELIETIGETVGTVAADGSYSVEYKYKSLGTSSGYVNVTYTDEDGNDLIPAQRMRLRPGESYSTYPLAIPGYELDTSKMPAKAVGVFSETVNIGYFYNQISSSQSIIHYKNVKNLSNLRCYAYFTDRTGKIIEPNGSRAKAPIMTNDSSMGSGWLTSTVRAPFAYVIFLNDTAQDPEQTGYPCAGEVWVENGVSSFPTKIITSHIDLKTGRKIADDVIINTGKVKSTDTYTTSPLEGRTDYITPSNAVGKYSVGTINVVYYYTEEDNGDPTEPATTEPSTAEPATTEPSTAEPATTEPSTAEPATTEPSTTEPATAEPVIAPTEPTAAPTESKTTDIAIDVKTAKNMTIKKTYKAGRDFVIKYSNPGKIKPKYKTSRKKCVSVTKKGRITCRKKGKATVTVTLNKVKIKYKITVTSSPAIKVAGKKYSAKKVYSVKKGKTLKIKISGKAKSIKNSYSSTNKRFAAVISKKAAKTVKIKALKKGKATITVKINGVKKFKIKVKVK